MSPQPNVLLFGLGGIGGVYACILALSKQASVSVVARSNYEQVKNKGLRFVSNKFGNHDIKFDGGTLHLLTWHGSWRVASRDIRDGYWRCIASCVRELWPCKADQSSVQELPGRG